LIYLWSVMLPSEAREVQNNGLYVKVLVLDVKILVLDVKVLVLDGKVLVTDSGALILNQRVKKNRIWFGTKPNQITFSVFSLKLNEKQTTLFFSITKLNQNQTS
jgi:hypothetical protein